IGMDGSLSITRIGRYTTPDGTGRDVFRVIYPSVINDRKTSILRSISVSIPDTGDAITFDNIRTIEPSDSNGAIVQATAVEPDVSQLGNSTLENTTLIYWKELTTGNVGGQSRVQTRAVFVRDVSGWSPIFALST